MTFMSQNYTIYITVRELQKLHYCREIKKITLLSERHTNGITVCKIKKMTFLSQNYKNDITVREIQK